MVNTHTAHLLLVNTHTAHLSLVNTHTAHLSLVNSLGLDTDQGGSLVAFYPVFSNINHACLANTKPVKVTI